MCVRVRAGVGVGVGMGVHFIMYDRKKNGSESFDLVFYEE